MTVEIIEDDSEYGMIFPLKGEFYKAKPYPYDSDKVTLIHRVDSDGVKLKEQYDEEEPLCNEYRCNIRIVNI